MAYLDDQALEREQTRQRLLEGRTPQLSPETMAAIQALGVNLSGAPSPQGSSASALQELLQNLAPKGVTQTPTGPLQVAPGAITRPGAATPAQWQSDNSLGGILSSLLEAGKGMGGQRGGPQGAPQQGAPQQGVPPGAHLRDAATRGRSLTGPQAPAVAPLPAQPLTSYGGAADIKGMPGGPSGRALTPEERKAASGQQAGADATLMAGKDFSRVDQKFMGAMKDYARLYHGQGGPYSAVMTSGYRSGAGESEHGRGLAIDMQLVDKATGKALPNYQSSDPKVFKAYQDYANGFHQYLEQHYPELAKDHRWGGYFSGPAGHYGANDIMHHDLGGPRHGMAGGSWEGGLTPAQAKLYPGLQPGGGTAGTPRPNYPAPGTAPAAQAPAQPQAHAAGVPPELTDWVAKKENFTSSAFSDYGTTNIGYGTAANGRTTITEPAARAEMNAELGKHLATIDALNPNTPPAIRNSLASLAFNTGGKAIAGTGLADAVKAGNWTQAEQIFRQYDKVTDASGNKAPLHGLTIRREQEAQAFRDPNYYRSGQGTTAAQDWGGQQAPQAGGQPATPPPRPTAESTPAILQPQRPVTAPGATPATAPASKTVADVIAPKPPTPEEVFAGDKPVATEGAPAPAAIPAPATVPAAAPAPPTVAAVPPPSARPAPPPPAPAPAPAPKPAAPTGIATAHKILDTKVIDLVKANAPDQVNSVPGFIGNKTLREAVQMPIVGGQVRSGIEPHLKALGVTPQDFDKAVAQPPPPGKRSDVGTSEGLLAQAEGVRPTETANTKVAAADIGVVSDAGPQDKSEPTQPAEQLEKTPPEPASPPEPTPQPTQATSEPGATTPQGTPQGAPQPTVTPEMAKAIVASVEEQERAPSLAPQIDAQPVLPSEVAPPLPSAPGRPAGAIPAPGAALSPGLATSPMQMPGSQGGTIALAGLQSAPLTTPLSESMARQPVGNLWQPPIPWENMQSWGWGGGGGSDMGGSSGGFSPIGGTGYDGSGGGMGMSMSPMMMGGGKGG